MVRVKSIQGDYTKKVILVVVDSLMAQAIDKGLGQNELPNFQFLIKNGQYYKGMVSSFPTMSVTIDSSLITGTYPDGHRVPGLTWYSEQEKRLISYGTGPMEAIKLGVDNVLADALVHLNGKHLNPKLPTIYEELGRSGMKSGSINGLIYRGTKDHNLSIPLWMQAPASLPGTIPVKGPDFLTLGSLSDPLKGIQELPDGLTRRMGLNNQHSIKTAQYLIKANQLPDFLYVYLPDLDQKIHKKGLSKLEGIKAVDRQLQTLLQSFGSPKEALDKAIFIIIGDSGMTKILPAPDHPVIELASFFHDYKILRQGESVTEDTEIILAVNETMAYVYNLKSDKLKDIAHLLRADPRIDVISWKEEGWIYAISGGTSKQMRFKPSGTLVDNYQQKWTVEQELEVLDLKSDAKHRSIQYGKYPDVLRRLSGALHSHPGEFLVVTAKPGYELADVNSPTHKGGGGHGAFGQMESLVPLIIIGTDQKPQYLRIVDLKPFILKLLIK